MLELRYKFGILDGLYLRTYHNELADYITRAPLPEVRQRLAAMGWKEVEPKAHWGEMVDDAAQRELRIPGDTSAWRDAALQVKGARSPLPRYAPLKVEGDLLVEVGTEWAPFGDAWRDLGGCG